MNAPASLAAPRCPRTRERAPNPATAPRASPPAPGTASAGWSASSTGPTRFTASASWPASGDCTGSGGHRRPWRNVVETTEIDECGIMATRSAFGPNIGQPVLVSPRATGFNRRRSRPGYPGQTFYTLSGDPPMKSSYKNRLMSSSAIVAAASVAGGAAHGGNDGAKHFGQWLLFPRHPLH